jgi:hypothetical protein
MDANEKIKFMAEVTRTVIDYLEDELTINQNALKAYDMNPMEEDKRDAEVKKIREIQAMILRDRVNELSRHIAVIKRMYPNA